MLLSADRINKKHNEKIILQEVSFAIEDHAKIALIGVNGTGKTTFLNIVAGIEHYDSGKVIQKNGLKIAYLAQEPNLDPSLTVLEQVMKNVQNDDGDTKVFEAKSILGKLGIQDVSQKIEVLSGGQKKRVALGEVLLRPSDLLLLDEPTNHLDNDMIEWLESYLIKYNKALLMVTHDRYFLEHITNEIMEIDHGSMYVYTGNYSTYLSGKAERDALQQSQEKKRQRLLKQELEWVRAGVQARGTKSKDRLQRFAKLQEQNGLKKDDSVKIQSVSSRLGKKTIEFQDLSKRYGDKVLFQNLSYHVKRHDRIGVLGPNGCGKTTLLKVLYKEIAPDHGEVIYGETVKVGYFKQGHEEMDSSMRVIDYIRESGDDIETVDGFLTASQMLEQFLFDAKMQYTNIGRLSGGERRRLYLLKVLMQAPNILFLDEPTNDLDITTLQILEDYLDRFTGALFVVSHDRYFLDRICDTMFVFQGAGEVKQMIGGYSAYMEMKIQEETIDKKSAAKAYQEEKQRQRSLIPSMTSKEKQELEGMEDAIAAIEKEIASLEEAMHQQEEDYIKVAQLANQHMQQSALLEEKMERWIELQEKKQQIEDYKNNR